MEESFGKRLKMALDERGMKPIELAKRTGINRSTISEYMSGRYEAKQKAIYKISRVLNVTPEWLMGYDVPMHPETDYSLEELLIESSGLNHDGIERVLEYARLLKNDGRYAK